VIAAQQLSHGPTCSISNAWDNAAASDPSPDLLLFALVCDMAFRRRVYAVATRRHGLKWDWEILRNGEPQGVRVRGGLHRVEADALKEGTAALQEFLALLKRERTVR